MGGEEGSYLSKGEHNSMIAVQTHGKCCSLAPWGLHP